MSQNDVAKKNIFLGYAISSIWNWLAFGGPSSIWNWLLFDFVFRKLTWSGEIFTPLMLGVHSSHLHIHILSLPLSASLCLAFACFAWLCLPLPLPTSACLCLPACLRACLPACLPAAPACLCVPVFAGRAEQAMENSWDSRVSGSGDKKIKGPDNPTRQLLPIITTKCCSGDGEGRKDKGGGGGSWSKTKLCVTKLYVKAGVWRRKMVCVTKMCVKDGVCESGVWKRACDKVVWERWCVTKWCVKDGVAKDGVWQSCAWKMEWWKMVRGKVVYEIWCVTKWRVKDGVWKMVCHGVSKMVCDKVVCERWCVTKWCVTKRCVKDGVWRSGVWKMLWWKMVCERWSVPVCERWWVTKWCVKDGVVKDGVRQSGVWKMVCDKTKVDVAKCHACHVKRRWMSPSAMPATQSAAASPATNPVQARRQGQPSALSATPATQNEGGCRQVPRMPRKVDVSKSHSCHVKRRCMSRSATPAMQSGTAPRATNGDQARHQVQQVPRLPMLPMSTSATPATWTKVDVTKCRACHAKRRWMSPSATPATWNEGGCHQAPRLPRKVTRRPGRPTERATKCNKCHACHAKRR